MSIYVSAANQWLRLFPGGSVQSDGFTFIWKVRLVTDRNTESALLAINDGGSVQNGLETKADGTTARVQVNYGSVFSPDIGALTVGQFDSLALVGFNDGAPKLRGFVNGAKQNVVQTSFPLQELLVGIDYGGYADALHALYRFYGASLSDAEVATEFASPTPVRTANLLTAGTFAGADLAACLVPSANNVGSWGAFACSNGQPARSAIDPTFGVVLTGSTTLPIA